MKIRVSHQSRDELTLTYLEPLFLDFVPNVDDTILRKEQTLIVINRIITIMDKNNFEVCITVKGNKK